MRLELWDERGMQVDRLANTPEMKVFLGGPEPEERIVARHARVLDNEKAGRGSMFLVMVEDSAEPAGSIGYWEKEWRDENVWEMGWQILPGFQGRGLASAAATATLIHAAAAGRHRWVHAYPDVLNVASNSVCRKAGFVLLGEEDFEFPPGAMMRCNDWRFDLTSL